LLSDHPYSFLFILVGNFFGCQKKRTIVILDEKKIEWMYVEKFEGITQIDDMAWEKKFPNGFF
jgi:hypothetical protein